MVQRRHSTGGERNVSDKETPESSTKITSISNADILCARGGATGTNSWMDREQVVQDEMVILSNCIGDVVLPAPGGGGTRR